MNCRAAEQSGVCRQRDNCAFCDGRIGHVTEVHNVRKLRIEVGVRSNARAMSEQFSVSDLALKR